MEIKELKEKKLQLEKDIRDLIVSFIKENKVCDIETCVVVETIEQGAGTKIVTSVSVNVDIKI